jgi:hypothetical protein
MASANGIEVRIDIDVDAPARRVWDALVDWDNQGAWMLYTTVRATTQQGRGVGARIEARTGFGRFTIVDPMVITVWQPPVRCVVRHTGAVLRGVGVFEVEPLTPTHSRLVWSEQLSPPLGVAGRLVWQAAAPSLRHGLRRSLQRFAALVEAADRA